MPHWTRVFPPAAAWNRFAQRELSGAVQAAAATAAGSLAVPARVSGAVKAGAAVLAGDVSIGIKVSGAAQAQSATAAGVIEPTFAVQGDVQAQAATTTGISTQSRAVQGAVTAQAATVDGSINESTLLNGLVSWHSLEEANGTRFDSEGNNDLQDNNGVSQVAGGGPGGQDCAQFTAANEESLSITDAAQTGLQPNNNNWTEQIWVRFDSLPAAADPIVTSKFDTTDNKREWFLQYQDSTGNFRLGTYHNGSAGSFVGITFDGVTVVIDTWYRLIWKHDADNNQISLKVDDETAVTTAQDINGIHTDIADFMLGTRDGSTTFLDGRMWGHGVWSRLTTDEEDTELFNGGAGLAHPFSPAPIANEVTSDINGDPTDTQIVTADALGDPTDTAVVTRP